MKTTSRHAAKKVNLLACGICAAVLLAFGSGCATTRQTEDLLTAAGFKARPAATAQQQAQLKSLPAHKVSVVQKNGKQYFVYPDATRKTYYVGQSAEYERYKKLRAQEQLAEDQLNPLDPGLADFMVGGD